MDFHNDGERCYKGCVCWRATSHHKTLCNVVDFVYFFLLLATTAFHPVASFSLFWNYCNAAFLAFPSFRQASRKKNVGEREPSEVVCCMFSSSSWFKPFTAFCKSLSLISICFSSLLKHRTTCSAKFFFQSWYVQKLCDVICRLFLIISMGNTLSLAKLVSIISNSLIDPKICVTSSSLSQLMLFEWRQNDIFAFLPLKWSFISIDCQLFFLSLSLCFYLCAPWLTSTMAKNEREKERWCLIINRRVISNHLIKAYTRIKFGE